MSVSRLVSGLLAVAGWALLDVNSFALTHVWSGATSGYWSTEGNSSIGSVPGPNEEPLP